MSSAKQVELLDLIIMHLALRRRTRFNLVKLMALVSFVYLALVYLALGGPVAALRPLAEGAIIALADI